MNAQDFIRIVDSWSGKEPGMEIYVAVCGTYTDTIFRCEIYFSVFLSFFLLLFFIIFIYGYFFITWFSVGINS